jgi:hypothetical protein
MTEAKRDGGGGERTLGQAADAATAAGGGSGRKGGEPVGPVLCVWGRGPRPV